MTVPLEPWETASTVRLDVERTQARLAEHAQVARTSWQRMVGLLAHRELPAEEAMVFPGCSSIHTVGMRFPIDVIFVDREWRVVALREGLVPGRLVPPVRRAWGVVEASCGTLKRLDLQVGDRLVVIAGTT